MEDRSDKSNLDCFKAYDVRGKVPQELDENLAYKIGRAFVEELNARTVVVGYDIRLESITLSDALIRGISEAGADVLNIGLCGTEEVYFATFHHQTDGGVMVTASHNPKGYNGMKFVREGAKPVSGDTGLKRIKQRILTMRHIEVSNTPGRVTSFLAKEKYIEHIHSYIEQSKLKPLKIVFNAGNGSAGVVINQLCQDLPFQSYVINERPDGHFPNGVPNPLLPENRDSTSKAVIEYQADFGVAWDGDFDRCFLFDEKGQFIEGYYLVGLLAKTLLAIAPGEKIIHDPRLTWNTIEQVIKSKGVPVLSKTGHAFIKEKMRVENALYGGEMSAHHYFRDFAYCDSGMIPWLLVAQLISVSGKSLSGLVDERVNAYPCSGEKNYKVEDSAAIIAGVLKHYSGSYLQIDRTDGVSLEFDSWRMNIRTSNTEPLLRLNIESKGNLSLVKEKIHELEKIIYENT